MMDFGPKIGTQTVGILYSFLSPSQPIFRNALIHMD